MQYAGLIKNDFTAGPGTCVTFFVQGCPHRCKGCHNPQTWKFDGGKEFKPEILNTILESLSANGIQRGIAIQGGEPLCNENLFLTYLLVQTIKEKSPNTPINIWTGYLYEDLINKHEPKLDWILNNINTLIDGPFIEEQKDLTLAMRGSKNQRIIDLKSLHK